MKGNAWYSLLIFGLGLVLGYFFAQQGGASLFRGLAGRLPDLNVSQPAVTLALIVVVTITIIITARRK